MTICIVCSNDFTPANPPTHSTTTSAPSPPVRSITASTESVSSTFTVSSAPHRREMPSLKSYASVVITRPGWRCRTACEYRFPTSPCPCTTTVSPGSIGVALDHATPPAASGRNVAAS